MGQIIMFYTPVLNHSGVGAQVVQSFIINDTLQALPIFGVFTAQERFSELVKSALKIQSVAYGYKYEADELLKKVKFVMTESMPHGWNEIE